MPRNGSGVYTLPAGNPVTAFTVITTAWANPTMSDIANEITNSLDRSGRGGMLAPFRIFDGSLAQPGLGFLNEVGIGLYRESAGLAHLVNTGTKVMTLRPGEAEFQNIATMRGENRHMAVGFKNWLVQNQAGLLTIAPSATVDAVDWDLTKKTTFNPDTGQMVAPGGSSGPYLPLAGGTLTGTLYSALPNPAGTNANSITLRGTTDAADNGVQITPEYYNLYPMGALAWVREGAGITTAAKLYSTNTILAGGGVVLNIYANPTGVSIGGVGATMQAPRTKLQVYGVSAEPNLTTVTGGIAGFWGSAGTQLQIGAYPTNPYGLWIQTMHRDPNISSFYDLCINPLGGRVGINTNSPSGAFNVRNGSGAAFAQFILDYQGNTGHIYLDAATHYIRSASQTAILTMAATGVTASVGLYWQKRAAQSVTFQVDSGTWDWSETSTHIKCGGASLAIANTTKGEVKRVWWQTANVPTFTYPGGSFVWATGVTVGAGPGLVSMVCADDGLVVGTWAKVF